MSDEGRRTFLLGGLSGVVAGGAVAFFAGRMSTLPDAPPASAAPTDASVAADSSDPPLESMMKGSFAQQGEDIIIAQIFSVLGVEQPTYIDIGAYDPIRGSNSFLFYQMGSHGVLVEPNPVYVERLRRVRPRDTVIAAGIGFTGATSADYYAFDDDPQENTFSKEQADTVIRLGNKLSRVTKMPLLALDDVLAQNFPSAPPSLLSIDAEGLDLAILKTLDFKRFRPMVICAETLDMETKQVLEDIPDFLRTKGYVSRGGTFVNTVFIDASLLPKKGAEVRDAH